MRRSEKSKNLRCQRTDSRQLLNLVHLQYHTRARYLLVTLLLLRLLLSLHGCGELLDERRGRRHRRRRDESQSAIRGIDESSTSLAAVITNSKNCVWDWQMHLCQTTDMLDSIRMLLVSANFTRAPLWIQSSLSDTDSRDSCSVANSLIEEISKLAFKNL